MPLLHLLRQNPVIAAVKDNASLQLAIDSDASLFPCCTAISAPLVISLKRLRRRDICFYSC